MTHDTPMPDDACEFCPTRLGWSSAKKVALVLVPLLFTAIVAAGSAAGASLVRDATLEAKVTALEKVRTEDIAARAAIRADVAGNERSAASDATALARQLGSIDSTLKSMDERLARLERRRR